MASARVLSHRVRRNNHLDGGIHDKEIGERRKTSSTLAATAQPKVENDNGSFFVRITSRRSRALRKEDFVVLGRATSSACADFIIIHNQQLRLIHRHTP